MTNLTALLLLLSLFTTTISCEEDPGLNKWKQQAKNVTIIRDEYGVAHIYGKTDADCVFGLMYAQCEDDFKRVEDNYITMLGRTAEQKGKAGIYEDLLVRLTIDSAGALEDYKNSPEWLKKLLQAHADGINYYLYKHPEVKPAVIEKFEPWFPLMYTDGSISAIQTGGLEARDLYAFYSSKEIAYMPNQRHEKEDKLIGSNGFAIAPAKSATGNALFYINPHVTFYFRPEVHMQSEEGLHVYGAVTWGQFFVYQGFNEFCGFMHTSSSADAADLYAETVIKDKNGKYFYKYNDSLKALEEKKMTVRYKEDGILKARTFTVYATHHGPVMAMKDGKWLSLRTMNRSLAGLIQSWQRTKVRSLDEYSRNLDLRANLSNNTVYADAAGNIAYWHGNYMPVRDTNYNWEIPVDGSTSKTEWKGMHSVNETVHIINPSNGWIQNTNNTPYSVSGEMSPARKNYPAYMAPDGENFRGINAVRLLSAKQKFTMDDLIAVGYDPHVTAFDTSMPILFAAYDKIKATDQALYTALAEPVAELKKWDHNTGVQSVATTLAIHWAEKMNGLLRSEDPELFADFTVRYGAVLRNTDPLKIVMPLKEVTDTLKAHFGKWQVAWGEINRMQRIKNSITPVHSDSFPSIPVGRAASTWGQLGSIVSRYFPGSQKRYATGGNSFVCVVEFGKKIKARSILAGGQSGDPASPHFFDQANMYADGQFKDVHFYKEDVLKNAKQTYHPGEN
ncbi:MAG TPA: penicillin acylase family protein [Chitinophagaceae bacterium]|nr:penicillin acylase family protein [Chitinophagaceae bacterium]